jgi:hypothetical protein
MRQRPVRELTSLLDEGPVEFAEFIPPEGMAPLDVAHAVRAELLSSLKQEADKAEEMAKLLRQRVAQNEANPAPQTMQGLVNESVGSVTNVEDTSLQGTKDIMTKYYYTKADPYRVLRLWHDLFRAIALVGDAEDAAAGRPTLRDRLKGAST